MADTLRAWYRDDSEDNLEELHQADPPQMLTAEEVLRVTGVKYRKVENCNDEAEQKRLSEGFVLADFLDISREAMGDKYEDFVKFSHVEHIHEDSEVRLVLKGGGYFEVRDYDDRWIRLHLREGDLIHLPAGIFHRLALDSKKHIKFYRLYSEVAEWRAFYRPEAESHPARDKFLSTRPNTTIVASP
ncbi:acireductone dioxygenase-like [Littorina saxatilis]|uniref:Acireductone dioxygenase n=1 Tax=Littorina saxatilis TaxID=31220 RepID=A0AAN9B8V5_9CAEN